jgi:DNA-directed RNA polymerase subunit RPC12/RpoP
MCVKKEYKCAVCGKLTSSPKTIMHADMHRYVCSEKCMWNFYKKGDLDE